MQRLLVELHRGSRRRSPAASDHLQAEGRERYACAKDSVELKVLEEEHRLDHVVIGRARAAEDEAEDGPENQIQQRHALTRRGRDTAGSW
jgi:hypothetical protein